MYEIIINQGSTRDSQYFIVLFKSIYTIIINVVRSNKVGGSKCDCGVFLMFKFGFFQL